MYIQAFYYQAQMKSYAMLSFSNGIIYGTIAVFYDRFLPVLFVLLGYFIIWKTNKSNDEECQR